MWRVMFPFLIVALIVACSAESGAAPTAPSAAPAGAAAPAANNPVGDGVLLIWHRSNEAAGLCEVLTASTGGELQAGVCNADPSVMRLSDAERLQLQQWAVRYGAVVITIGDPATAEALFMSLEMNGSGSGQPTEAEQQQMLVWAQAVYERAVTP